MSMRVLKVVPQGVVSAVVSLASDSTLTPAQAIDLLTSAEAVKLAMSEASKILQGSIGLSGTEESVHPVDAEGKDVDFPSEGQKPVKVDHFEVTYRFTGNNLR